MFRPARLLSLVAVSLVVIATFTSSDALIAADHGDAPRLGSDRGADIADVYLFLDPNDNSKVVLIFTIGGFIVPGEATNFGIFDPNIRYVLQIENTGDPRPDRFIDVTFTERVSTNPPQTATVRMPDGSVFTAPVTPISNTADTAAAPVITTQTNGVAFFAGLTDDPFFFDIPAFGRFVASVRAGSPNPTVLQRGRDSFAGYNVLAIALSIPAPLLRGTAGNVIGVDGLTQRRANQRKLLSGPIVGSGPWVTHDRAGNPAINVALIPFARKNDYNAANTLEDADGKFVPDIVGTLTAFGTNATNIGILASVAITKGDFLHLDTTVANSGTSGGNNAGAGFPNGRRLSDDVIDTELFFIANQNKLGDSVDANDVPLRDTFPFLAPSQQPRQPGTVDDSTRN